MKDDSTVVEGCYEWVIGMFRGTSFKWIAENCPSYAGNHTFLYIYGLQRLLIKKNKCNCWFLKIHFFTATILHSAYIKETPSPVHSSKLNKCKFAMYKYLYNIADGRDVLKIKFEELNKKMTPQNNQPLPTPEAIEIKSLPPPQEPPEVTEEMLFDDDGVPDSVLLQYDTIGMFNTFSFSIQQQISVL